MDTITELLGNSKDLTALQMSLRGFLVFIIGLILIRISGRRSFGMRMPLDNIITVLIGAVLSRVIVGASPFIPTVIASAVIVLTHRIFAFMGLYNSTFDTLIKGKSRLLYKNGVLNRKMMKKSLLDEKDITEGVRINSNLESIEETESIYLERDGQISVVKKNQ
jgi:uncharacterized membrane protein YcaP (DUF421 family)